MLSLSIETIAMICHEANRAYCQSLGDYSQVKWCETSENIKQSSIDGVNAVLSGKVKEPKDSHTNWLEFKKNDGWRYGEIKDEKAKTHPCIVDYDSLPTNQRIKDYIFFGVVSQLANFVELESTNVATTI